MTTKVTIKDLVESVNWDFNKCIEIGIANNNGNKNKTAADIRDEAFAQSLIDSGKIVLPASIPDKYINRPMKARNEPVRTPDGIITGIRHDLTNYNKIMDELDIQAGPATERRADGTIGNVPPFRRLAMHKGSKYAKALIHRHIGLAICSILEKSRQQVTLK
jgi:hypothetical protein